MNYENLCDKILYTIKWKEEIGILICFFLGNHKGDFFFYNLVMPPTLEVVLLSPCGRYSLYVVLLYQRFH